MPKKVFKGIVASTKNDKTAIVEIVRIKVHPLYKKRYHSSKKYKIHDPQNQAQKGDKVVFEECRPISKDKKWRLIKIEK